MNFPTASHCFPISPTNSHCVPVLVFNFMFVIACFLHFLFKWLGGADVRIEFGRNEQSPYPIQTALIEPVQIVFERNGQSPIFYRRL